MPSEMLDENSSRRRRDERESRHAMSHVQRENNAASQITPRTVGGDRGMTNLREHGAGSGEHGAGSRERDSLSRESGLQPVQNPLMFPENVRLVTSSLTAKGGFFERAANPASTPFG
jgi:hypothetical protein